MFLFLIITQLFIRHKMMDLESCGLLWCIYQLFGLSFWRHPFAADDFSQYLQMKNKLIYILDGLCSRQCKRHSKYTWYSFNINKERNWKVKKIKTESEYLKRVPKHLSCCHRMKKPCPYAARQKIKAKVMNLYYTLFFSWAEVSIYKGERSASLLVPLNTQQCPPLLTLSCAGVRPEQER